MDAAQIAVTVTGLLLIVGVAWFFFGEREKAVAHVADGGVQVHRVTVKGGYSPDTLVVQRGQPVRLVFDRQETSGCSEEIVLPDFGIRKFLPPFQKTAVQLKPEKPGSYEFTCGMGMLRGTLIVEETT